MQFQTSNNSEKLNNKDKKPTKTRRNNTGNER